MPTMTAFQIIFTPTSAAELGRMPKELQLQILGEFRGLPQHVLGTELEEFGKLESDGQILHPIGGDQVRRDLAGEIRQ